MFRPLGLCTLLALALGCSGDPLVPAQRTGVYALQTANDAALPFVVRTDPSGESLTLLADTLTFGDGGPDGVFQRRVTRATDARGAVTLLASGVTLQFKVRGDSVTIGRITPCPINASCIANSEGRFVAGGLRVTSNLQTADNHAILLRYVRIADR